MAKIKKCKKREFTSFSDLFAKFLLFKILNKIQDINEGISEKNTHKTESLIDFNTNQNKNNGPFIKTDPGLPKKNWIEWVFENFEEAEDAIEYKLKIEGVDYEKIELDSSRSKFSIYFLHGKYVPKKVRARIRQKTDISHNLKARASG